MDNESGVLVDRGHAKIWACVEGLAYQVKHENGVIIGGRTEARPYKPLVYGVSGRDSYRPKMN